MEIQEKKGFGPIRKEQELKKYYLCLLEMYRQRYLYLVSLVKGQRSHYTIYSPFTNDRIPLYPFFTGTLFLHPFTGTVTHTDFQ